MLARIDPTDFRLAAEEQRASLQQSLARLGLEALPEGEIDVTTLPPVARAQAEASNAKAKFERARQLFEREPPLLSAQDFADIRTQNEVAETSVRVERLNAEAMLAEARSKASALAIAQKRLEETRIIAPMEQGLWCWRPPTNPASWLPPCMPMAARSAFSMYRGRCAAAR